MDIDSSKPLFEALAHTNAHKIGYRNVKRDPWIPFTNVEWSVSRPNSQYGRTCDDVFALKYNANSEDPYPGGTRDDEVMQRYNANNDDPYASSIFVRSNVANYGPEYGGVRNPDE
ncbi:hypothetical protein LguiB_012701 [Lonicera macranthoides]